MITLFPPSALAKLPDRIKLHSGAVAFPDRNNFGKVRVVDESEAAELESLGWSRDRESSQAKAAASDLLQKGFAASLRQRDPHSVGGASAHPRTEFGDVMTPFGRVTVAHDRGADSIAIHGVNIQMTDLDRDLRQLVSETAAAFNAAFSAEEQVTQRALIGLIVGEVMRRGEWLQSEVKRRLTAQRYD
jgi:hypothetical protein